MKIIGLFPLTGNGGIASWAKKFMTTFPDREHAFSWIDVSPAKPRTGGEEPMIYRITSGLSVLLRVCRDMRSLLRKAHIDILHTTTSGNIGSLRDYAVAKLCKNIIIYTYTELNTVLLR